MIPKVPNLTPVRHIKDHYTGWIDGVTKMQEFFTGNTACEWQYRIIPAGGEQRRRVAPPEDLEINSPSEFPPHIPVKKMKSSYFKGETRLHALGYQVSELSRPERWDVLVYVALPHLGMDETLRTILNLVFKQIKTGTDKFRNALVEWHYDIDSLLKEYGWGPDLVSDQLLNYLCEVKAALQEQDISGEVLPDHLRQEQQRRSS